MADEQDNRDRKDDQRRPAGDLRAKAAALLPRMIAEVEALERALAERRRLREAGPTEPPDDHEIEPD